MALENQKKKKDKAVFQLKLNKKKKAKYKDHVQVHMDFFVI